MQKHVALYVRVSKKRGQDTRSQKADLEKWAAAQNAPVKWYADRFTGRTMDRPGWNRLQEALDGGGVSAIVVWRLDRLGRTAKGLTALFADLRTKGVNLVSLRDGLDLSTPAGRLMAHVLASVAQYETEIRAERIMAGQEAARAAGKAWGGGRPGRRVRLSVEKETAIRQLRKQGKGVSEIARVVGLSRPTVYRALG
ncbi:MAG: recombinase family protein [Pirellulales bacterium]|nr:recombinase family protein [Pirellulales bacterium]